MDVKILRFGRGSNPSASKGAIVRVTCDWGYTPNMGNRTARCSSGGRWLPRKPECNTSPCRVPSTPHGVYYHFDKELGESKGTVEHSEVISLTCEKGFQLMGPETIRCWYGDWAVNKMPSCVPGPCELKDINHGMYLDGYRPGLTISHGSAIRYSCDPDYAKAVPDPVQCLQARLKPDIPKCMPVGSQRKESNLVVDPLMPAALSTDTATAELCTLPERLHNTLLYRGSTFVEPSNSVAWIPTGGATRYFPNGTEVLFKCLSAFGGKKTTWKIVCQDGVWVGRPHNCDAQVQRPSLEQRSRNKPCIFKRQKPSVVSFLGDRRLGVSTKLLKFPAGTELVHRCIDIGKFSFEGSVRRRCVGGQWTGTEPSCWGLSQENGYAIDKAPTVLFRHQTGQIAQSNDGKLIVYPGTVLHLECLWIRKYGTPQWEVSHKNRKYLEGWTSEPGRDSQLEYRLTIQNARTEDSGLFTCVTPMEHRHAVEIVVSAVHCPPIPQTNGLVLSSTVTKMNVKVVFTCESGSRLKGDEQATCLPSGRWSATPPTCQKIPLCPYPGTSKGVTISSVKFYYELSETIVFGCKQGYKIHGRTILQCLEGGRWSGTVPTCHPLKKS